MHLVSQPAELIGSAAPARRCLTRRPLVHLRVRWQRDRLTRELAEGAIPRSRPELRERAHQLTARRQRERLAVSLEGILADSGRPARPRTARAPVPLLSFDVRGELATLAGRLRANRQVRAQGVALALLLITDPASTLYSGGNEALRAAIADASKALDDRPPDL